MEENVQEKSKEIVKFLKEVVQAMAEDIGFTFGIHGFYADNLSNPQEKAKEMMARANKVAEKLAKHDSSFGKLEMIEGKKPAKGVAILEE